MTQWFQKVSAYARAVLAILALSGLLSSAAVYWFDNRYAKADQIDQEMTELQRDTKRTRAVLFDLMGDFLMAEAVRIRGEIARIEAQHGGPPSRPTMLNYYNSLQERLKSLSRRKADLERRRRLNGGEYENQ